MIDTMDVLHFIGLSIRLLDAVHTPLPVLTQLPIMSRGKEEIPVPIYPGWNACFREDAITGSISSATTFKSSDIHVPSDRDLATLPNKSFVS